MFSFTKNLYLNRRISILFLMTAGLSVSLLGCQNLFHAQDAPLKGQSVTVSVTVPEAPPPAAVQPLQQGVEQAVPRTSAQRPLDNRLLPTQAPAPVDTYTAKSSDDLGSSSRQARAARTAMVRADTVLAGKTVVEDLMLRGSVLIKGSLIIAPQATLRVEPGTVIRFVPEQGSTFLPRLVIQGRIVAAGTAKQPIVFAPAFREAVAGDWGGLVLLNSEKKNSLEFCRIEGAQTGLETHFSHVSGRGFEVVQSQTGVALYDSEVTLQGSTFSRCDVGCRLFDSELDLRDSTVGENRQGVVAQRSSFTLNSVKIINNSQEGIAADQCRFRLASSSFAENRSGVKLHGGDGQVFLCRFYKNRENGAELLGVRIRISSTSFSLNAGAGVVLENALGTIVGSAFSSNSGGNLQNCGNELFAALLNWWDSADEKQVAASIGDPTRKDGDGAVLFVPFLEERPATAP